MTTCRRFAQLRQRYEREIDYQIGRAKQHAETPSGRASATAAKTTTALMARSLSSHVSRCLECR
ncbi:hypothetical protein JGS22_015205 [Streptomyces sp. P38-E01]|uniref:Uncharacterized protein n=1 Tax=Streptomyces tardus TaxID=2780544 RepID=A0A949N9H8_9ACTN|nr:hypothetical protein [Streptomyces tardus]MBU7598923.1 hypothetical protein [Streptomyces tardus]